MESYLYDESRGRVLWQLEYLLAVVWSVQDGGRPTPPPWRDSLDADLMLTDALQTIVQLWFPDWIPVEWRALSPADQTQIADAMGVSADQRQSVDIWGVLHWPWAAQADPDQRDVIARAWVSVTTDELPIVCTLPYLVLNTDDVWIGDRFLLEMAQACQALRAAFAAMGYGDSEPPKEVTATDGKLHPDSAAS